jgi:membrane-bound metal-dependent hydrolase YbcI (DUF457 family)
VVARKPSPDAPHRIWMQIFVTVFFLLFCGGLAIWKQDPDWQKFSIGMFGIIIGYWLK